MLVLFDGVCNFCNKSVNFIIDRDTDEIFHFASLQSPAGQKVLGEFGLDKQNFDSMVLVDGDRHWTRSSAALQIARRLKAPWPLFFYLFYWIPPFLRNVGYGIIARNRYRWFGKRDTCPIPTPDVRARFIDDQPDLVTS